MSSAPASTLVAATGLPSRLEQPGEDADRSLGSLWLEHMRRGAFEEAWQASDAIRARGNPDPHRVWCGEPPDGKRVLLRSLHGFGDAVQFLRFAPAIRARAAHLTLQVAPLLLPLAACIPGLDSVTAWGTREDEYDVQAEVTELPYLLRTTLQTLPPPAVLRLPGALLQQAEAALRTSPRPAVGFVWACGAWNPARSIPWPHMERLAQAVRGSVWNLQGGPEREVARGVLRDAPELCNAGPLPMAAMLSSLDLVITPDTLAAHLAASLGTPTWLLLQCEADWRWMTRRSDSPWYPSMRIFRNPRQDAWGPTLHHIRMALQQFTADFLAGQQPA